MFPLPLLPTIPDDLNNMPARHSIRHQNAFMKNALLRGLNVTHAVAPIINTGTHPAFHQFMEYVGMVCDMVCLHFEGDEVFLKSLSDRCHSYRPSDKQNVDAVCKSLKSLGQSAAKWDKDPSSHQSDHLLAALGGIGEALVNIFNNRVRDLSADALPEDITDQELGQMVIDTMIWLATNSDITVLLPFCTSHHNPKDSKFWPPITADGIKAMPELVQAHPEYVRHDLPFLIILTRSVDSIWKFAPFDPVTKQE